MDLGDAPQPPFEQFLVETPTGCLVNVTRPAPLPVLPLYAAAQPPSSTVPDATEGGSNANIRSSPKPGPTSHDGGASLALPLRRRRCPGGSAEPPSAAATEMIGRFQMIINIVESAGTSAAPRPEVGELVRAIQRLKLSGRDLRHSQQKRRRRPAGSPDVPESASGGDSTVSLLQETIAAIEQMRLSEPMERSGEYAGVLTKLNELLRGEEAGDG